MKKILLVLLLPALVFALKDTIKSSGTWAALTWSTGSPPTVNDTVYKTGAYNDTMKSNYTVVAFVCTGASAGTHWQNGYALTVTGNLGFQDDGTGTRDYGIGMTATGASGTIHFGSGLASTATGSCIITMTGTTGMTLDIDKTNQIWAQLNIGTSAIVQNTSSGVVVFYKAGDFIPLIMGDNSTLTNDYQLYLRRNTSGDIFQIGTGITWDGASLGTTYFQPAGNDITLSVPAFIYSGSGSFEIKQLASTTTGCTMQLTGDVNVAGPYVFSYLGFRNIASSGTTIFKTNNHNITCNEFRMGSNAAATTSIYLGSSIISMTVYNGTQSGYDNAAYALYMQTAQLACSGDFVWGILSIVDAGTSLFTLNGSLAQTITSNGKSFYDLTINNSGSDIATPVSFADSATLTGDLTLTDGPVVMTDIGIKAVDYIYSTADSVRAGRLWLSGNYTRSAGASKCDTSGQHIIFLAGNSHTMAAAGKVYARVTANAPLTINGGATITLLSFGVDGISLSIESGTKLNIDSIAGIGGTSESPDSIICASGKDTIDFAGSYKGTIANELYLKGQVLAAGDTVTLTKGIDGGDNEGGWIFPSTGRKRARSFGMDWLKGLSIFIF
jgi:hypothetical protein